jgi:hypothetical protein
MPKTDINTILKNGSNTTIKEIDYTTQKQIEKLKQLKKKSETALLNKEVNLQKLNLIIINPPSIL